MYLGYRHSGYGHYKHDHRIQTINVPLMKFWININLFSNIKCKTTTNSDIHSEIQITDVHALMR
jgi:hypothetical protein